MSDDVKTLLAANVRYHRKRLGLSQEEFADKCGLHRTYIGGIERRERNITLTTLERIAAALGLSVAALFAPLGHNPSTSDSESRSE